MYIEAEERGLRDSLEALVREESWRPMEDAAQTGVLRSASELFGSIKRSLQRCSRFVSRGEPMLHLMGAFQVGNIPSFSWCAAMRGATGLCSALLVTRLAALGQGSILMSTSCALHSGCCARTPPS